VKEREEERRREEKRERKGKFQSFEQGWTESAHDGARATW